MTPLRGVCRVYFKDPSSTSGQSIWILGLELSYSSISPRSHVRQTPVRQSVLSLDSGTRDQRGRQWIRPGHGVDATLGLLDLSRTGPACLQPTGRLVAFRGRAGQQPTAGSARPEGPSPERPAPWRCLSAPVPFVALKGGSVRHSGEECL